MDEEVRNLLTAWSLEEYIDVFKQNSITSLALPLLNESMINELFPLIGPRAIFSKNLEVYKSSMHPSTNNQIIGDDFSIGDLLTFPLYETPSCTKTFAATSTPTPNSPICLPANPPVTNSLTEESTSSELSDLRLLLNSTLEGKGLLNLDKTVPLNNAARLSLVRIIGTSILRQNPEQVVRSSVYASWAHAIVRVFPQEKPSVYFHTKVVESTRGIITRLAGKLPDQIHNLKRKYRDSGVVEKRRRISGSSESSRSPAPSLRLPDGITDEEDSEEKLLWLKNSTEPWTAVEHKWEETTQARLNKSKELTIAQYFGEYTALKKPKGYLLLQKDFEHLYTGSYVEITETFPALKGKIFELAKTRKNSTKDKHLNLLISYEHDPKKIDRCSYEEYYNQTLKHVEFTIKNSTKDECKSACETEARFVCRGFTWQAGLCDLHAEDPASAGSWLLRRATAAVYYRRVICLNISVECSDEELVVTYRPRGRFRGRVYVPGRGERCAARGAGAAVRLALPLRGACDVNFAHAITHTPTGVVNRTMAYVMVMIQNNPIIQTAGDRWVRVGCSPGAAPALVDAAVAVTDAGRPAGASEPPAAASAVYGGAPVAMRVVRARHGDAAAAVSLGEPLELRLETTEDAEIEAYHLVASSRLGDSSVLLLDSRGCPTGQVDFPAFTRSVTGGTQRLSARFKAFRFPTSHVVRFALMVRFCDGKCEAVSCITAQARSSRQSNESEWRGGAGGWAGGAAPRGGRRPLELELVVGAGDVVSADTVVRADHRANLPEEGRAAVAGGAGVAAVEGRAAVAAGAAGAGGAGGVVCVHELLLLALALAWLAVQVLLLLGCCVLVKRYRNLAELSVQKEYQAFDNVGFDTGPTHRRVHWPDQGVDVIHAG